MDMVLEKTIQEFKMWGSMSRKPGQPSEYFGQIYQKVFLEQKMASSGGEKYPEICSEKIWEAIVKKLLQKDYQFDTGFYGSLNEYCQKIAYFFHASLQGTACYPKAGDILNLCPGKGIRQGLLADGQCFTMVQLQRGLKKQNSSLIPGIFQPDKVVLSWQMKGKKPSERLMKAGMQPWLDMGIKPSQILHVGSRLEQDIQPARRLGMRTALFAGDRASLQATAELINDPRNRPDLLLTDLWQLDQVVG